MAALKRLGNPSPDTGDDKWHGSNINDLVDTLTGRNTNALTFAGAFTLTGGLTITGSGNTTRDISISHTITSTGTTAPDYSPFSLATTYTATDVTDPRDLAHLGVRSNIGYGTNLIASMGTAHTFTSEFDVQGSGSSNNEFCNYFGWMRYRNGSQGRAWFTDYSLHGPISTQPGLLNGINMFINNYYNGSPSDGPAGGMWIVTKAGSGGGKESGGFDVATTYPVDVGLGIVGLASSNTNGFTTAIQIGGYGSGWMTSGQSSIIGTGVKITDIKTAAIEIGTPSSQASAPTGIKFTASSTPAFGIFMDFSAATQAPSTAAIKLGTYKLLGSTMQFYDVGNETFEVKTITSSSFSMLRVLPTYSTVANNSIRSIFRLYNSSDTTNAEYLEMSAWGTDGYKFRSFIENSGTIRPMLFNINTTTMLHLGTDYNLGLFGAASAGGGVNVIFIANANTNPSSNPTGGGILYVDSGALKYRGSSGTVTTLGAA